MKNCSFCGAENEDAAVFCEECGKSFYKKCDKCGAENKLTAKFCNKCGARFIAPNTICYTATEKIESTWIDENSISHDFNDGNGYIVLKDGVDSIDGEIFNDSKGLAYLTIPDSVTEITIPYWTTDEYKKLLPSNVWDKLKEYLEPHTIYYEAIEKLVIQWILDNSISHEFANGKGKIRLKDDVTEIGKNAFFGCLGLTAINIPDSVKEISVSAFYGCIGLTAIVVTQGNSKYDSRDNCNAIIETATNTLVTGCMNTVIPDSVTEIGYRAFSVCIGLTSINIPDSVTKIGSETFENCSGLTSIVVAKGNGKYDSRNNCNAIIETATNTLVTGCMNTVIPDSVTEIGWSAFYGCSGLTSINIPNSVKVIGKYAFEGCSGLTSISIPDSVTEIGESAFRDCSGLTSINIPDSEMEIGWGAFRGCSGLTSINIPDSVTEIGWSAFYGCSGLTSIVVAKGNGKYDSRNNCNAIIETATNTLVTGCMNTVIPDSVTEIGNYAFFGCSGLTSINIPDSVKEIRDGAFGGCSGLTSINIPDSVKEIRDGAFGGCKKLTKESVNKIGKINDGAFISIEDFI